MDDQVLAEVKFHQETVSKDANSPLHLIREKEMEIAGRVLAAKREAEEIVATARRQAAETIVKAEDEAEGLAAKSEAKARDAAEAEAVSIRTASEEEVRALRESVASRQKEAVEYLVDVVAGKR